MTPRKQLFEIIDEYVRTIDTDRLEFESDIFEILELAGTTMAMLTDSEVNEWIRSLNEDDAYLDYYFEHEDLDNQGYRVVIRTD